MKSITPRTIAKFMLIGLLAGCMAALFSGCRGAKETTTSSTEVKTETTKTDERDQKILEQSRIISEQARRIEELSTGAIFFESENSPCPDSEPATVEITPGGGIKATGRNIKSATVSKSKVQDDYNILKQSYDSLALEKQKSDSTQKTVYVDKEKQVIKKVIPGYMYFLLLLAFLAGGFLGWHKERIIPFNKPKN